MFEKNFYKGPRAFAHGEIPALGVLLVNLGTPAAPTAKALRPYLKQFLWDPRVIEIRRPFWWTILHLFVLTFRPKKSAELYASIWTDEGSPLLVTSKVLRDEIEKRLRERVGNPLHVALGMTYGEPSIASALEELDRAGCRRVLVFPLYPHYSSTSTGASFDAVMKELLGWRWVPELRTINGWHDDPAYVRALAASIREVWDREGSEPEKLVLSYHGIPRRYFLDGDPYHCLCHKTSRLVAEELGLAEDRYVTTFQSLFGKEEWIQPYTDRTLEALARSGVRTVDVICPGFSIDCLETLEEIDGENREVFLHNGGERFRYLPCLNDRPDHLEALTALVERHLGGWAVPPGDWSAEDAAAAAEASRRRAEALEAVPRRPDGGFGGADGSGT